MSATAAPVLEVVGVHVALQGKSVLRDLNCSLADGECRAVVGLNGAGKTTALRVILGMLRPRAGRVLLYGRDIASTSRDVWRQVGHLVETPFSYPELTARQNIEAAARLHGADPEHTGRAVERMSEVLALTGWLDVPVRRLSLGTRQKVGLVGALAHEPNVVVLDEPTNGLDPLAVVGFRDLLREVTGRGGAVLVTGHHFDELTRLADRVEVLHRGRIIDTIVPEEPGRPGGADLERVFFDAVLAADLAADSTALESGAGPDALADTSRERTEVS
ncbi:ABC transporter ATP-binding protein [Actinomyces sp. oral taxon 170]|uniref:ABC transporter ATP-binding protein n=1 Tax=Actinomyces sp. oral taxon 170 TaxID=712117 RepID=UPI000205C75D|nr:ABC transporter ATP-binding protein [Actinomyces sp. oral taxon 170]EGF56262.1 ABC transporter, ATP-binding protein [Actinomyces sp. oral taxon 170 str. F0386]